MLSAPTLRPALKSSELADPLEPRPGGSDTYPTKQISATVMHAAFTFLSRDYVSANHRTLIID